MRKGHHRDPGPGPRFLGLAPPQGTHLGSWQTWVPCLPLEALQGQKSWVGVPAPAAAPRQVTPIPAWHLGTAACCPWVVSPGCRAVPRTEHSKRWQWRLALTGGPIIPGGPGGPGSPWRERDTGWGCPWRGRVAGCPAPRRTPGPHPQPRLAILAIQSFQASRALWGQGEGVTKWLAPRGSEHPYGTCSGQQVLSPLSPGVA